MAVYADTASSKKIIQEFQVLSDEERHHVQLQLLEGTEVRCSMENRSKFLIECVPIGSGTEGAI